MCKEIIGKWILDSKDIKSQQVYGNISIEFTESGNLIYTVHLNTKDQKSFMTYRVHQNFLITNQPSFPREEKTEFKILPNEKLELYFDGVKSTYIKSS